MFDSTCVLCPICLINIKRLFTVESTVNRPYCHHLPHIILLHFLSSLSFSLFPIPSFIIPSFIISSHPIASRASRPTTRPISSHHSHFPLHFTSLCCGIMPHIHRAGLSRIFVREETQVVVNEHQLVHPRRCQPVALPRVYPS